MNEHVVALLTDFGRRDSYVSIMKGVILGINNQAKLVDISHEIALGDVKDAAYTLATCVDWFPEGTVFLTVVDPGVGSSRKAVAIRTEKHFFVGPDNGIFTLALRREKFVSAIEIDCTSLQAKAISHTFHGRDIFAPVAAHLSQGCSLYSLGCKISQLVQLDIKPNRLEGELIYGSILHIDNFGNIITSIREEEGCDLATVLHVGKCAFRLGSTYSDAALGQPIAYWGSSGYCEAALNGGSASELLQAKVGDEVILQLNCGALKN